MGFRFRNSINLGGGTRLNLGKKGIGISNGIKGLRVSSGADGKTRVTASIPGTGISYQETFGGRKQSQRNVNRDVEVLHESNTTKNNTNIDNTSHIEFNGKILSFREDGNLQHDYFKEESLITISEHEFAVFYGDLYIKKYYDDWNSIERIEKKIVMKQGWSSKKEEIQLEVVIKDRFQTANFLFKVNDQISADRCVQQFNQAKSELRKEVSNQGVRRNYLGDIVEDYTIIENSTPIPQVNRTEKITNPADEIIKNAKKMLYRHFTKIYKNALYLGNIYYVGQDEVLAGDVILVDLHICVLTNDGQINLMMPNDFESFLIVFNDQNVLVGDIQGNTKYQLQFPIEIDLGSLLADIESYYKNLGLSSLGVVRGNTD